MAKSRRAYKSAKRGKEIARQKKQEEKRLRRLSKEAEEAAADPDALTESPPGEDSPEDKE
jgi:hypothetical protein